MNSPVGRLGGHSHDSRNLTFLLRSREATTHRVYLNEVDTPLVRFWALPSVGPYSFRQRVPRFDRLSQQLHAHLVEQLLAFG